MITDGLFDENVHNSGYFYSIMYERKELIFIFLSWWALYEY